MKKLIVICLAAAFPLSAGAVVNFVFDYSDISNGTMWTPPRQASLDEAAAVVAALFVEYDAEINIQVTSQNDSTSSTLATAENFYVSGNAVVPHKILTGEDINSGGADGKLTVNWGRDFDISADPSSIASDDFDFQSTIAHELMHSVGFMTTLDETGASSVENFNNFDQFVGDALGVVIEGGVLDVARYQEGLTGGAGTDGLLFFGPRAMLENGGEPVPLYTPTTFVEGSSLTHLDDDVFNGSFLMESMVDTGPGIRTISRLERAMLVDIGYNVTVPEPSSALLLLLGGIGSCLLRRRK